MGSFSVDPSKEFKAAHQSVIESIDAVRVNSRNYLRAKPRLKDLEIKLLAHLGKQGTDFFAKLNEFYVLDSGSVKILSFIQDDTKDIKVKTLVFFDRYPATDGDIGKGSFLSDFIEFSKSVITRIELEENYLLPLVEKMIHPKKMG